MRIKPLVLLLFSLLIGSVSAQEVTPTVEQERAISMTCINVAEMTFYLGQQVVYKNDNIARYVQDKSAELSIEQMQIMYSQYLNVQKWVDAHKFSTAKGYASAMFLECREGLLKAANIKPTQVSSDYATGFMDFLGTLQDDQYWQPEAESINI